MTPAHDGPAHDPWDEAAEGWNRHTDLIRQWLREATDAMLEGARIAPGQRVLDVAAGAGDQTVDVARRVGPLGDVLATDMSARILELANARFLVEGLARVRTQQADAQDLALANADFDAAICRLGLMFCATPARALNGIRSALVPGGRFSALVFGAPSANPCVGLTMRIACQHAGLAPPDPFAPGSLLSLGRPGLLERLLHEAGFADVEVRPLSAPFRAQRCEDYVGFVRASAAPIIEMLDSLPPGARADAWADIEHQLDRFSAAGGWEGPNELLLCCAVNPRSGVEGSRVARPMPRE